MKKIFTLSEFDDLLKQLVQEKDPIVDLSNIEFTVNADFNLKLGYIESYKHSLYRLINNPALEEIRLTDSDVQTLIEDGDISIYYLAIPLLDKRTTRTKPLVIRGLSDSDQLSALLKKHTTLIAALNEEREAQRLRETIPFQLEHLSLEQLKEVQNFIANQQRLKLEVVRFFNLCLNKYCLTMTGNKIFFQSVRNLTESKKR